MKTGKPPTAPFPTHIISIDTIKLATGKCNQILCSLRFFPNSVNFKLYPAALCITYLTHVHSSNKNLHIHILCTLFDASIYKNSFALYRTYAQCTFTQNTKHKTTITNPVIHRERERTNITIRQTSKLHHDIESPCVREH